MRTKARRQRASEDEIVLSNVKERSCETARKGPCASPKTHSQTSPNAAAPNTTHKHLAASNGQSPPKRPAKPFFPIATATTRAREALHPPRANSTGKVGAWISSQLTRSGGRFIGAVASATFTKRCMGKRGRGQTRSGGRPEREGEGACAKERRLSSLPVPEVSRRPDPGPTEPIFRQASSGLLNDLCPKR